MSHLRLSALAVSLLLPCIAAQAQFDTVINVPPDVAPGSIPSRTQLNLSSGGALPNNFQAGETTTANDNVEVNISGGMVGRDFRANSGSRVNISGGQVGKNYVAHSGSLTNIAGGVVNGALTAGFESVVNIQGGALADGLASDSGGALHVFGGEMLLDGRSISGLRNVGDSLQIDLLNTSVLTGVLADGTPFAFSGRESDVFQSGTLTLHRVTLSSVVPTVFTASTDPIPLGIRGGQSLLVDDGGAVGNHFNAGRGSSVVVDGGSIGSNFESSGNVTVRDGSIGARFDALPDSVVSIEGGNLGNFAQAYPGSIVVVAEGSTGAFFEALSGSMINVVGGKLGNRSDLAGGAVLNLAAGVLGQHFDANNGSVVNISGGRVGSDFDANSGSTINISGGIFEGEFEAFSQSTVNISGGQFADGFLALTDSNINITGRDFALDGAPIAGLEVGVPFELDDRNVTLNGAFASGEEFDFVLNFGLLEGQDLFQTRANLVLHLLADADFNNDGLVWPNDLDEWEGAFGASAEADSDNDRDSDGIDFLEWQRQLEDPDFGQSIEAATTSLGVEIPEPTTATLLTAAAALGLLRYGRKRS